MTLPKAHLSDPDMVEKAQAMIRCGHDDAFISDYLGMIELQVGDIRGRLPSSKRGRPISFTPQPAIDDEAGRMRYAENCRQSAIALGRAIDRMEPRP